MTAQHAAEYRQTLGQLKKDYIVAYTAQHSKARLGVAEDKTKSALKKDPRLVSMLALAGISLLPTSQLTSFEEKLDKLRSCASLVDSELAARPGLPALQFSDRPTSEGDMLPAANVLKQLDDELDRLLESWVQTLVENLDDPIIQSNFELLKDTTRKIVSGFANTRNAAGFGHARVHRRRSGGTLRSRESHRDQRGHQAGAAPGRIAGNARRSAQALRGLPERPLQG